MGVYGELLRRERGGGIEWMNRIKKRERESGIEGMDEGKWRLWLRE